MGGFEAPVAIVGAGPVGLSAALCLARRGIPTVILEANPQADRRGSRAIRWARPVLQVLSRLGCAAPLLEEGVSWSRERVLLGDEELFVREASSDSVSGEGLPAFLNVPQWRMEEVLWEAALTCPLIDVRRSARVTAIEQGAQGVTVVAESRRLQASYAVGCDGARSTVRALLGLPWLGHDYPTRFLIADVRAKLPFADERRFVFPRGRPEQVMFMPQPDNVWRIDWPVGPYVDLDAECADGGLEERLRAFIPPGTPYELVWVSSYRFHCRRTPTMRLGRVFLAGDAAHTMSPFGGRGANSGILDAVTLADAFARLLASSPREDDSRLDAWNQARCTAAERNLAASNSAMRFMVPPTPADQMRRDSILQASRTDVKERSQVNTGTPFDEIVPDELLAALA